LTTRFPGLSVRLASAALLSALALSACSWTRPNPTPPGIIPQGPGDPSFSRLGGPDSGVIFKFPADRPAGGGGGYAFGVNAFLWRGALETLASLPLVSADPYGGVIITDWYSPPNSAGQRFKDTVLIGGRDLRGDAVRVNVFHQVYQSSRWVDAPVGPEIQTGIQNKILDRARVLRDQTIRQG
jgi:hypothetical protein